MHSAFWDEDEDIEGKGVAVIGNGATGVQIAPEIASRVKQSTVFQRSPRWIILRNDQSLPKLQQVLYKYFPIARRYYRSQIFNDQNASHSMVVDRHIRESGAQFSIELLSDQLPQDHALQAQLAPSYLFGCERVLLSNDFYSTIRQAHVALKTRSIRCITEKGVELPFNLIVFATRFQSQSFLSRFEMTGRGGH